MLQYLRIRNFGLFADAEVELHPGLSVFTGETGAGKSMIVDAVMACLGQRTSRELLRAGEERAVVEILAKRPDSLPSFDADDPLASLLRDPGEVSMQKDILADRSYQRVNGKVVPSSLAQDLGRYLVDIHGQQEHHSLMRPQNYLGILDSLDRGTTGPQKAVYAALYKRRQRILEDIRDLGKSGKERQREIDLLAFQVKEITDFKLTIGEESLLQTEHKVLSSQKRLIELAALAYGALYSSASQRPACEAISEAIASLAKAGVIDPAASAAREALEQAAFSLEAAVDALREYQRGLSANPARLSQVEDRLDHLARLKSKYGETEEAILRFKEQAASNLARLSRAEETLAALRDDLGRVEEAMSQAASSLSDVRGRLARFMEESVTGTIRELGMPGGVFQAVLSSENDPEGIPSKTGRVKPFPDGVDRVAFSFTANVGETPQPVNKVASGGELSRLMLALKSYLGDNDPVPTLVFDEIDAGIGGNAGQAVARKLWQLGRRHQVMCVTHLASIAAAADFHYLVEKEERDGRTVADVRLLTQEERVSEIARMLSGSAVSISADHARELLRVAGEWRKE